MQIIKDTILEEIFKMIFYAIWLLEPLIYTPTVIYC
jgi:hypothetical protein